MLVSILIFMPVTISIKILKDNTNDKIILKSNTLFGLIKYKIEIPFVDLEMAKNKLPFIKLNTETKKNQDGPVTENKSRITFEEMKKIKKRVEYFLKHYSNVVGYVLEKLRSRYFLWITELGIGDAAITGMISGFFWILKGELMTIVSNNIKCSKVILNVIPRFNEKIFKTTFHCIITIKMGYIIIAALKFGFIFLKKDGEVYGKSSDRSANENYDGKSKRHGRRQYHRRRSS